MALLCHLLIFLISNCGNHLRYHTVSDIVLWMETEVLKIIIKYYSTEFVVGNSKSCTDDVFLVTLLDEYGSDKKFI